VKRLIWLPIILGLFSLFCLSHHHPAPMRHPVSRQLGTPSQEQKYLRLWFDATNEEYFGNKIPKNTQIVVMEIPPDDDGTYTIGQLVPLGNHQYEIDLDPRFNLNWNTEALTVDHEMCHEFLNEYSTDGDPNHGSRFQACMQRLADRGAFAELW
jgi:hypothetical protein